MIQSLDIIEDQPAFSGRYAITNHEADFDVAEGWNYGYETRVIDHRLGQVILLGHCLAPEESIQETVDAALRRGDATQLTYLPGSYAAIVTGKGRLDVLTDPAGQFPLYYGVQRDTLHLSTSSQVVAETAGGMPSKHGLAMYLLSEISPIGWCPTAYEDVSRLPGATRLEVAHDRLRISPYDSLAPRATSRPEAIASVGAALQDAIAVRMAAPGTVTADFSGGYDSTALAFLAAAGLPETDQLSVFHGRYGEDSKDTEYARAFADLDKRLDMRTLQWPIKTLADTQDIRQLVYSQIQAHASGPVTHLVGTGGDALFHSSGMHVIDLWRQKKLCSMPRFANDILNQATLANKDPRKLFSRVRDLASISYHDSLDAIADGLPEGVQQNPWLMMDSSGVALLGNAGRQKIREVMQARQQHPPDPSLGVADFRAITDVQMSGLIVAHARAHASRHDLQLHAPYLDSAVIRACFAMHAYDRHSSRQYKPVLVEALRDTVPSEIFARHTKGDTISDTFADLRQHAPEVRELLDGSSFLARMGIIDAVAVSQGIAQAEMGLRTAPLGFIARATSAERWLRQQYQLPSSQHAAPILPNPKVPREILSEVYVPEYVRAVQDVGGIALYNLQNKMLHSVHPLAQYVIEALQQGQVLHDASAQFVLRSLRDSGFIRTGPPTDFTIRQASPTRSRTFETVMHRADVDTSGLTLIDYARMAGALKKSVRLLREHSLWELTSTATEAKRGLPLADPIHARRLLSAGHVLGRFYMARVACQELSLAVVLAEAQMGRAADWAIGIAPDPRRVHAWPQIDGIAIQTPHDEVTGDTLTPFGVW